MNGYVRTLAVTGVASFLALWMFWPNPSSNFVRAEKPETDPNPLAKLNQRARDEKHGGYSNTRELVDAVVDPFTADNALLNQDGTVDEVKDRLVRAQLDYRGKGKNAVSENNVVQAVNDLCERTGAPEYAKTDRAEVRKHRMRLLMITPQLTTFDSRGVHRGLGRISPNMSPVEAAHVTLSLAYQKVLNADYQKSDSSNANEKKFREREMLDTTKRSATSLTTSEQRKNFIHRSLDTLGIPK